MLLYPKSALVIANDALALAGTIELVPAEAPLTLLVWGVKRVLPVRLTQFSITEQAYDPGSTRSAPGCRWGCGCSPTATCPLTNPGYHVFLAHQVAKEVMATIGSASAIATAGPGVAGPSHWGRDVLEPTSRYADVGVATTTVPDGTGGSARGAVPAPPVPAAAVARCRRSPSTSVTRGDRLDLVTAALSRRPDPVLAGLRRELRRSIPTS